MTPPLGQTIESRTYKSNVSKRGRKPYTTPEFIDVTGRTHFMVVRRLQTNKKPKKKINSNECKNCELNDEYVDILEERVNKLEGLVNNLNNKVTNVLKKSPTDISNELNSYSNLDIESLINLSNNFGQMFNNNIQQQQVSPVTAIEEEFHINENIMPELWNTNIDSHNMF